MLCKQVMLAYDLLTYVGTRGGRGGMDGDGRGVYWPANTGLIKASVHILYEERINIYIF